MMIQDAKQRNSDAKQNKRSRRRRRRKRGEGGRIPMKKKYPMLENFDGAECSNDSNPQCTNGNGIFATLVSFSPGSLLENLIHHITFNVVQFQL